MQYTSLADKTVVITGASSGIGKLAAEEFLKRGANVVLAARSLEPMQEHLAALRMDDSRALAVQVDVSDAKQVRLLADSAINQFGKIDIWVNNAAISAYGPMESFTPEEVSRIIDVNLKGQFYGSQEAIRTFKNQSYGNLINVSSVLGKGSSPLQALYTATKHGIVGFSSALREELIDQPIFKHIEVSVVLPASMDTPLFRHAKSKLGVEPSPIPPIYHPMVSVQAIIECALSPKPEVIAGNAGVAITWASKLFPTLLEKYMGKTAVRQQTTHLPKEVEGEDNLFIPMPDAYGTRGGIGTTGEHILAYARKHKPQISLMLSVPLILFGTAVWLRRRA
jgi:NAD(P)-dependent dehydrogenase (short-subunit alcohol dehydrogenase family)